MLHNANVTVKYNKHVKRRTFVDRECLVKIQDHGFELDTTKLFAISNNPNNIKSITVTFKQI